MHYSFDFDLSINTSESDPEELICKLNYGVLRRTWIYFRGGCADLAHIKIFAGTHQLFPTNLNGDFAFDNYVVEFEEYYPLLEKPYELKIRGWNRDDTFRHTITLMFTVLSPESAARSSISPVTDKELEALLNEYEIAGV
jgi:hypothetical protein